MLRSTPFHSQTAPLNRALAWRDWSGFAAASQYDLTHLGEYFAVRNSAALFDVSPLFKYDISGPDAAKMLSRMLVRDVRTCRPGQAQYTCWCDDRGHVLEDGVVLCLADGHYRLTAAHPNLRWLELLAVGMDVTIGDVSAEYGILSLQGPNSHAILRALTPDVTPLRYFEHVTTTVAGHSVLLSRTGYTGDLGYELWVADSADAPTAVWHALVAAGADYGLTPAGMLALDLARVEAGLLLIDVDYDSARHTWIDGQKSTVLDLGFGWMVRRLDQDDRPFIGRATLARELVDGSRWAFRGLVLDAESVEAAYARHGLPAPHDTAVRRRSVPVYHDGAWTGYATSSVYSPRLKAHVALATLAPAVARPGTPLHIEMTVEHQRVPVQCTVAALPFFNPPRKRAQL